MKKQAPPLDYADIILSQSRARCEFYVSYNGVREKLAVAPAKPLLAHLRSAELQFERGNGVIRLEPPRRVPSTWFNKGTLERFVHFVSFPEVLERVTDIGDELFKLKEVHAALSKTFSKDDDGFGPRNAPFSSSDAYQEKSSLIMEKRNVNEKAVETSKRQLLRAMDARLVAVNQEHSVAVSHALSAGFDKGAVSDLIKFSQHFGTERLRDACMQFLNSCFSEGMDMSQQADEYLNSQSGDDSLIDSDMSVDSSTEMEMNSETEMLGASVNSLACDSWSNSPKGYLSEPNNTWGFNPDVQANTATRVRGRWGPPERIQISFMESELQDYENLSDVSDLEEDGHVSLQRTRAARNSGDEQSNSKLQSEKHLSCTQKASEHVVKKGNPFGNTGTFFSHLQKMVKQIEARKLTEDQGMHFTSVAINNESQILKGKSLAISGLACNIPKDMDETVVSDIRSVSVTQPQYQEDKTTVETSSLVNCGKEELKRGQKAQSSGISGERIHGIKGPEGTQLRDQLEEPVSTSSERISVQAAISLFESKSVGEPVVKKLVRQDSLKGSTSQKTVVRRWSVGGPADNIIQQKVSETFVGKDTKETLDIRQASIDNTTTMRNKDAISNNAIQGLAHEKLTQESMCMQSIVSNHMASNMSPSDKPTTWKQPPPPVDLSDQLNGDWQSQFKLELEMSLARKNRNRVDIDGTNLMAETQKNQVSENPKLKHVAGISKASHLIPNSLAEDNTSVILQSTPVPVLDSADWRSPKDTSQIHPPKITNHYKHGSEFDSSTKMLSKIHTTELLSKRTGSPFSVKPFGDTDSITQNFEEDKILEVLPLKSVVDIPKNVSQKSKKLVRDPRDVRSVKEPAKHDGDFKRAGQNRDSLSDKPVLCESVMASLKEDKITNNVSITSRKESSTKGTNMTKLKHEMGTNSQAPVDLYMQALVVMIDKNNINNHHHRQNSISLSDNEYINDKEGRLYEQYQKLRDAKQLKENPAKRAEREAKLKYMKATLDKRKIEMEAGVKKSGKYTKEMINAGKIQSQRTHGPRQLKEPQMASITPNSHMTTDQAQTSKKGLSNLQKSSSKSASSSVVVSSSKSPSGMTRRQSESKVRYENGISRSTPNVADLKDVNKIPAKQSSKVLQVVTETRTLPVQQNRSEFIVTDFRSSVLRGVLQKSERTALIMHSQKIKRETDTDLSNKIGGTRVEDLRNPLRPRATRTSTIGATCTVPDSLKDEENQSDSTEEDSDVFVDASCDERVLSMEEIDQDTAIPEGDVKKLETCGLLRQVSDSIIRKMKLHENAYDFGNN